MKYLFSAILLGLFIIGCAEREEKSEVDSESHYTFDTTDVATTTAENPDEEFYLKYAFERGKTYKYRLTNISQDYQTITADTTFDQHVNQTIIYLIDLNVKDVDTDGTMEIECSFSSVKLDAEANDEKFEYHSGVTTDSMSVARFTDYEAIVKNPFFVRLSSKGEVLEVFKADKIVNKYLELKGYTDSLGTEEKTLLRRDIIEGALKPILVQLFREVPQTKVAKDSSWFYTQPPSRFMIFTLQNTNTYNVANLEQLNNEKVAVINAGLDTKISGENKITDRGIKYDFKKPETTASGKIYFNVSKGFIQKSKTQTTVEIFYTMEMPTPAGTQKGSKKEIVRNTNIVEKL